MTFADFDRLTYLTDFFELIEYNLEIWKECSAQFEQNFQALQKLCEENDIGVDFELSECGFDQNSLWLIDFCRNVPDKANKIFLKEFVKKKYKDEGMELPERFERNILIYIKANGEVVGFPQSIKRFLVGFVNGLFRQKWYCVVVTRRITIMKI